MTDSRRKFLKSTLKGSSLAIGGLVLVGCGKKSTTSTQKVKNTKNEILYNGNTPYWREYYANAK